MVFPLPIARDFGGKNALIEALIDYCLMPPEGEDDFGSAVVAAGSAWSADDDTDLATMAAMLGEMDQQRKARTRRVLNQLAMRALARGEASVALPNTNGGVSPLGGPLRPSAEAHSN